MKRMFMFLLLAVTLFSCSDEATFESANPYAKYFYPYDSIPKVYLYRDVANGLDEQFHRIYGIKDSEGNHIIVETYSADGRIIEALNYNTDSLDIMDHMVVNRNAEQIKAELFKYKIFPMNNSEETWFASRFPGFLDSTLILREVKRKIIDEVKDHEVMGEKVPAVLTADHIRMTNFNPFTEKEYVQEGDAVSYFAKGFGLVEWHSKSKKVHYRLEKVMSQEEWMKIITR
jgi:hypothetical protein